MPDRAQTTCDECGQTDDHPKWQDFGGPTKHHDCLSLGEELWLRDSSEHAAQVIDAAKSGTHGDDLLDLIQTLNGGKDNG